MYYVQQQAHYHLSMMQKVPNDFPVCSEYLQGLDKEEFIAAYQELRQIFLAHYETAMNKPDTYGLVCHSTKEYRPLGNEARESEFSFLWFPVALYAIGKAGRISDYQLIVDIALLKETLKGRKIKKLPQQIQFMQDHGFIISNWNGKSFLSKEKTFIVEYPDNPTVLHVLKAAANKVSAIESNPKEPQKFDFYRITQYPHMLESLFATSDGEVIEYDASAMLRILKEPYADFLSEWNTFMKEHGLRIVNKNSLNKIRYVSEKGKDSLNFIEYMDYRRGEEALCKILLRLKLNHPGQYMDYIESLPEEIKDVFRYVSCGHCSENCARCITYTLEGEDKECCGCFGFEFKNVFLKDMQYYKKLFLLEQDARR